MEDPGVYLISASLIRLQSLVVGPQATLSAATASALQDDVKLLVMRDQRCD